MPTRVNTHTMPPNEEPEYCKCPALVDDVENLWRKVHLLESKFDECHERIGVLNARGADGPTITTRDVAFVFEWAITSEMISHGMLAAERGGCEFPKWVTNDVLRLLSTLKYKPIVVCSGSSFTRDALACVFHRIDSDLKTACGVVIEKLDQCYKRADRPFGVLLDIFDMCGMI